MNHNTEDDAQDFGFDTYSGGDESYSGLYIPEVMDCRMCGYCVSKCPTHNVRSEENYSPRGRVRLIERVIKKNDVLSDDELAALNACTLCRACETVCPSKMDYNGLYQKAMEAIESRPKKSLAIKLMLHAFAKGRSTQRALNTLTHMYRRSGGQWLVQKLPDTLLPRDFKQLNVLLAIAHPIERVSKHSLAKTSRRRGDVALFAGCVANTLDTHTHNATIQLLTGLGYDVRVPGNQSCCGAMYAHNGDMGRARTLARTNIDAFRESGADSIIYSSSGCGAFLSEYDDLLKDGLSDGALEHRLPIFDILEFLVEDGRIGELSFRELNKRVAVHEPCSQRNVLKTHEVIYEVLQQIPKLDVVSLADNAMCCGAGGTQMVTQPDLASPLRDEKVRALIDSKADILLSTNITCALHLARGVREAGHKMTVIHPANLLAQQMT